MLDLALAHLPVEYWLSYLDDILVYSMDTWDHLKHLKSIVEAHRKAGIKIQPKKTKIFQTETEYLGHKVCQGGVQMLDQYVKDIQSWPCPTSCKEMSSFLGFTGYYKGFIPRYSALTNRMNSLKKAEKFVWTEDIEKDFLELKAEFSAGCIQAYPDFDSDEPFILTRLVVFKHWRGFISGTRWSEAVSWLLGAEVQTAMRGTIPAPRGNLALAKCMKKLEHILKYWPPFLVSTDAASLKYIVNLKSEETIFQHCYVELAQFEFIVIHMKGSENVHDNALSRAKHLDEPTAEENEEYQEVKEVGEMKITFA